MEAVKKTVNKVGLPRVIIIVFLLVLTIMAVVQKQNMSTLASDVIVRFGMNLVLALAMVPAVNSGTGMNFGLPVGIMAGILAGIIGIEMGITGFVGITFACLLAIPFAVIAGWLYGKLLNAVKGSEMVVGTYVGYSIVSLMCIAWLLLPFKSSNITWPIGGKGLRTTITLTDYYDRILSNFMAFEVFGVKIPTGLLIVIFAACFVMFLFTRSKTGIAMQAAGSNPMYAVAAGINVNKMRIIGTILSTVLGAIGIILYAQSFGFYQLYLAPLNMAFAPIAAVLLGGASTGKIKISHVIIGTFLFQALITIALPVANQLVPEGGLSEISRIIVSNGIILYALTQAGGKD